MILSQQSCIKYKILYISFNDIKYLILYLDIKKETIKGAHMMAFNFLLSLFFASVTYAETSYVDTMIVISVDVSGSISNDEYLVQKKGILSTFQDESIKHLLTQCTANGIAVTYVEWSGIRSGAPVINQLIDWTQIKSPEEMDLFAQKISGIQRSSKGETDIVTALNFAQNLFLHAPFISDNKIVSLSTDGRQGFTMPGVDIDTYVQQTRNKLGAENISINAIAIDLDESTRGPYSAFSMEGDANKTTGSLKKYLENNVIIGPRAFVTPVSNFESYSEVFKQQISIIVNGCIS